MTPSSSASSYCSGAEFLLYYDVRVVGDLLADDGTQVASGSVAGNSKLAECLLAGSGDVEAACLVAERYTPTDLAALTGAADALLRRIVAALAMQYLRQRRARPDDKLLPEFEWAQKFLDRLRLGEKIFGFTEVQEAGQMAGREDSFSKRQESNGMVYQASPFFGNRAYRQRS